MHPRAGLAITLFLAAGILIAFHATLLALVPGATYLSDLLTLVYPVLGATACMIEARGPLETRHLWVLLGCGFMLAAIGQFESTYYEFTNHTNSQTEALSSDFFFFAYGIPIMLAICSRDRDAGLKIFVWLDGAQALLAAILVYLLLFPSLPFDPRSHAISATDLMYVNDVENWILIAAVTLRLFSNPGAAKRRFYRSLSLYLWVYGIVATVLGYLELKGGWGDGPQDAAWGIPYLPFLGTFAFQSKAETKESEQSNRQRSIGLFIENLSPILFTLVIIMMATKIAPQHPWFGFACISTAIVIYGIRTAILQIRYARSQEELTTAIIATEDAGRAKGQFLANMSHEIRTPMNGILGMTELALSTPLSEEQRSFLTTVKSSADRLLTIINEILDYSKLEAGKTVLDAVPFHLPDVVGEALKSLAFLAHQKDLELIVYISADVPRELVGDAVRLGQVLINLVGNAIKFTSRGEVSVEVSTVQVTNSQAGLQFSIRDTGIGIPVDQQGGLFQAFQQVQTSGKQLYGGTGLGLALSRHIVTLMGGAIELESAPEAGTKVTFTAFFSCSPLPTAPALPAEPLPPEGVRVLIIDDNATQRSALSQFAQQSKMTACVCGSGESGLAELNRAAADGHPYRLLLLDEQMPGIDGLVVLKRMRALSIPLPAVIMMLRSSDQVASAARCRQMGVSACLIKPILPHELIRAVMRELSPDSATSRNVLPVNRIAQSLTPLRILLAEDNLVNQKVAMTMLAKMGHSIVLARNGLEALEQWKAGHFDLVLMDVQMPEMTGIQATMQIRKQEAVGRHIPIVAMTASAMDEERERCLAAGMDDFISKPISLNDLARVIATTFANRN